MRIEFDIPDNEFDQSKTTLLANLNLPSDASNVVIQATLSKIAKSSFYEYQDMIVSSGMPTKTSEIVNNRIINLIQHYFLCFPNEYQISQIFNLPISRCRSLLVNLKSTHKNVLRQLLENEISEFLRSGVPSENNMMEFEITSTPILQHLNELIARKKPGLARFKHKYGSSAKVLLEIDTYTFLKTDFNID